MFLRRGDEVWKDEFGQVVGAEHVDVDDGFEGVCGKLVDGGQEVSCCTGTKDWRNDVREVCSLEFFMIVVKVWRGRK